MFVAGLNKHDYIVLRSSLQLVSNYPQSPHGLRSRKSNRLRASSEDSERLRMLSNDEGDQMSDRRNGTAVMFSCTQPALAVKPQTSILYMVRGHNPSTRHGRLRMCPMGIGDEWSCISYLDIFLTYLAELR